jgi:hypothetical protein
MNPESFSQEDQKIGRASKGESSWVRAAAAETATSSLSDAQRVPAKGAANPQILPIF